jgi:hypothetical protein
MDNKTAFTDYLLHRKDEYKKEQIKAQKRLENQLTSHEIETKMSIKKHSRNRRHVIG